MSEEKIRILFIVDVEEWAWGILTKTLSQYLPETYECKIIARDDFLKWGDFNPEDWSLVLCYIYKNRRALNKLSKRNTVIVIGSDPSTINQNSLEYASQFRNFLALNGKVYFHLLNLLPMKRVYWIVDGTDINQFKPQEEIPPRPFTVGWIGAADRPLKRYMLAEHAISLVDGVEFKALKGLDTSSYIPHERMHEYYQGIDCLLCTSIYEVHSTVLYEAMACGLPVLTTRTGDAEDYIVDGLNGYLLDYDCDAEEIANHINMLKNNPEKRRMIGENARETVTTRLSWEKITPRYMDLFERILGKRRGVLGKRRVGILWWSSELGNELSVVALQNEAIKRVGAKPIIFDINTVFENHDELTDLNNCDLIFTSVMPAVSNPKTRSLIKAPILFQIDGYGATTFHDAYVNPMFSTLPDICDVVTFLDMNVYEEFRMAGFTFKPDSVLFIPNGCNPMPKGEPTFKRDNEVIVGTLLKENMYKKPWIYLDSAKYNLSYRYPFPVMGWTGFLAGTTDIMGWRNRRWGSLLDFTHRDGVKDTETFTRDNPEEIIMVRYADIPNVEFIQHIPYKMLGDYLESCNVFTHYSGGDAFAKTVTEAFSYGKAPLVSDVVRVQGVSVENLPLVKDCIGLDETLSYHKLRSLYRSGDGKHLKITSFNQPIAFAEATRHYVEHPREYDAMCVEAKRWAEEWITWEEKWEHIFRVFEEKGLI